MKVMRGVLVVEVVDVIDAQGISLRLADSPQQRHELPRLFLGHLIQAVEMSPRRQYHQPGNGVRNVLVRMEAGRLQDRSSDRPFSAADDLAAEAGLCIQGGGVARIDEGF
ncbi:MAG: hypothetical protein QM586_02050 [Xenophilus sp.]